MKLLSLVCTIHIATFTLIQTQLSNKSSQQRTQTFVNQDTFKAIADHTITGKKESFNVNDLQKGQTIFVYENALDSFAQHYAPTILFEDLPVLIVNDWSEITETFLEAAYRRITSKTYNTQKAYHAYWKKVIATLQKKVIDDANLSHTSHTYPHTPLTTQ